MQVLRPAKTADLADIYALAMQSGVGLTTLTKDQIILAKRIESSIDAFSKKVVQAQDENYFFVLEDIASGQVVGTSAIEAAVGYDNPFYSYRLSKINRVCSQLNLRIHYQVLNLTNDFHGKTELCTLYLRPEFRRQGNGHLLSRGRLLFMAEFPERFTEHVFSEMRGVSDKQGISPFWESVGKHFFLMDFNEADRLTTSGNKQFIADLMPRNPIYTVLLSTAAQNAIGQAHPMTIPAMKLLENEGFKYQGYVDIFDAGPTMQTEFAQIKTVSLSKKGKVKEVLSQIESPLYLISNASIAFRACLGQVIELDTDGVAIMYETAELLKVKPGDTIRYVLFR